MPALGSLVTFVAGQVAQASQVNSNFSALRTWADNSVVLTDVAKTISAIHTFSAGFIVSAGGINVTGNSLFANNLTVNGAINGATLTTSGAVAISGGATISGGGGLVVSGVAAIFGSGIEGNASGPVVANHGVTITAGGLTVSAGGANITGNSTITGNLTITGTVSGVSVVSGSVQSSDTTTTSTSPTSTNLSIALGANQTWRLDFDLAVSCDNTGGVTLVVTAPAGATIRTHWLGATSSATTMTSVSSTSGGAGGAAFSTFNSTASDGVRVTCSAYIVTSGTSGNGGLTVASVTGGQTSKVLTGSTVLGVRIA